MDPGRRLSNPRIEGLVTDWRARLAGWSQEPETDDRAGQEVAGKPTGPTLVDETAFRTFYERTAPGLRSYLRMQGRDAALADDLLQDSFVRFLRAGVGDLNEFQMKSYLYKTATSVLNDHHRARTRERRWIEQARPEPTSTEGPGLSPDMRRILSELKPRQRSLLWLAYVEGFRHQEIADLLGIREKSVRVLLSRARKQLAGRLRAQGLGPDMPDMPNMPNMEDK